MSTLVQSTQARVLVVDDVTAVRYLLSRWLTKAGYQCSTAASAAEAWAYLQDYPTDLVTLDISMPGGSGLDLLDRVKQDMPDIAAVMLTDNCETTNAIRALAAGAYGYLLKPIEKQELLFQAKNALERRNFVIEKRLYTQDLESKVREQTQTIRLAHEQTIHRLVKASLYRDEATGAHIKRTGWYSELLATSIGWDAGRVDQIRLAAPMHDIGKIGIPDAILNKPGKLTPEEYAVMQTHTVIGAKLLTGSEDPILQMAQEIALCHHERWDGTGYPRRLQGAEIPESARILAIVDVYDALSHDRVYRSAMSPEKVLAIMQDGRGSHFEPRLLDAFLTLLPEMYAIASSITEDAADDRSHAYNNEIVPYKAINIACSSI
jgi:putative two-component system response regulator